MHRSHITVLFQYFIPSVQYYRGSHKNRCINGWGKEIVIQSHHCLVGIQAVPKPGQVPWQREQGAHRWALQKVEQVRVLEEHDRPNEHKTSRCCLHCFLHTFGEMRCGQMLHDGISNFFASNQEKRDCNIVIPLIVSQIWIVIYHAQNENC